MKAWEALKGSMQRARGGMGASCLGLANCRSPQTTPVSHLLVFLSIREDWTLWLNFMAAA